MKFKAWDPVRGESVLTLTGFENALDTVTNVPGTEALIVNSLRRLEWLQPLPCDS